MYFSIFVLVSLLTALHQSIASEWNYGEEGPDVWSDRYPLCAGQSQSPIDIRTACTAYRSVVPFAFSAVYSQSQSFKLINNGHTISGTYTGNNPSLFTLTGGGLMGTYTFSSFHLHWGENYKSGSEHQLNGQKYSGEIHFIHVNSETNQTAVLGMFIKSEKETNTTHATKRKRNVPNQSSSTSAEWEAYLLAAEKLEQVNESTVININLASLMSVHLEEFWGYTGSLTTPPCTEGIIWTVFKQPITVNDNQFRVLRNHLYPKDFRSPQPRHSRIIYRSFLNEAVSSISDYTYCLRND